MSEFYKLICGACEEEVTPFLVMKEYGGKQAGNFFLRAECPHCHGWIRIVPQTPVWLHLYKRQEQK